MPVDKITVKVSRDFLFEAAALVYNKWSKEYDALKAELAAKNDGSKDWAEFHETRLANGIKSEAEWRTRSDEAADLVAKLKLL